MGAKDPLRDGHILRWALDSGVNSRVYTENEQMAQGIQIGQVARETGLTVDAIRFYEMNGFKQDGEEEWDLHYQWQVEGPAS